MKKLWTSLKNIFAKNADTHARPPRIDGKEFMQLVVNAFGPTNPEAYNRKIEEYRQSLSYEERDELIDDIMKAKDTPDKELTLEDAILCLRALHLLGYDNDKGDDGWRGPKQPKPQPMPDASSPKKSLEDLGL